MKILFNMAHSLRYYGGAEKWAISTMNGLTRLGHEVDGVYLSYVQDGIQRVDMDYVKKQLKCNYEEIGFKRGKFSPLQMAELPDYGIYDVVYTTASYYSFLKQILKHSKTKNIFGFHDPALQSDRLNFLQRRILNEVIPKFNVIHLQDESQKKVFKHIDERFKVLQTWYVGNLPNLTNTPSYTRFTVLFTGRHETSKGIDTLIELSRKLPDDIDIIVTGTGNRSPDLRNSSHNMKVLGFVSDLQLSEIMLKSHTLLYPSYSESTTSMTLNDGLANGLPILFRPIPQNSELLGYKECIKCESVSDFINGILSLKEEWEKDSRAFLIRRQALQNHLIQKGDYVKEFYDKILNS